MNFFQLYRIFFNLVKSRRSDRSDFLFTVLEWPQPEAMARADCGEYRQQGFALGEKGFKQRFARQQSSAADVPFGSKADMTL
jgi:hypothetical protein